MERKIFKTGIYGFIFGLLFSILYYPDRTVNFKGSGSTTYYIPMREYIFDVLRMSIKISFASMIAVAVVAFYRSLPKDEIGVKQFAWGVVKSFAIGLVLFLVIFSILSILI